MDPPRPLGVHHPAADADAQRVISQSPTGPHRLAELLGLVHVDPRVPVRGGGWLAEVDLQGRSSKQGVTANFFFLSLFFSGCFSGWFKENFNFPWIILKRVKTLCFSSEEMFIERIRAENIVCQDMKKEWLSYYWPYLRRKTGPIHQHWTLVPVATPKLLWRNSSLVSSIHNLRFSIKNKQYHWKTQDFVLNFVFSKNKSV